MPTADPVEGGAQEICPLLTIIVTTYNRLEYVIVTLDQLYRHLCDDIEVIVVDDGSTDDTSIVLPERYPWVVFLRCSQRRGPSVARNQALQVATGAFVMPLDSDCFIVPEAFSWLLKQLRSGETRHLLFACRSWPEGERSVACALDRPYSYSDILLKTFGEVIPVLATDSLRRYRLEYPNLFAGGEPLLLVELSRLETLHFVDRVLVEYRTDIPSRISSAEYQIQYALEIAEVFEAYLPFLADQQDPMLKNERARILEKAGVYLALGNAKARSRRRLLQAMRAGRWSATLFLVGSLLPQSSLALLFHLVRRLQRMLSRARKKGRRSAG